LITGSYDIPVATLRACAVFTNTMPTNAYRSSGRPEVTFALERLIDIAAADLGFDRIELRRMNLIGSKSMPYTNAVGMTYDSGAYETNMDLAMRIADWDGFELRRRDAADRGRLLGRGLSNYVESSIGAPKERVKITVSEEDRVDVVIGTQPSGQGHETSFARRLPFGKVAAPRRHGHAEGCRGANRQGKGDRRSTPERMPGPDGVRGRPIPDTQRQSVIQLPRAGRGISTIGLARRV